MNPLLFPSRAWCDAAAAALQRDPSVRRAIADFGAVVAGLVIEKGDELDADFCVLARIEPGREFRLEYPQDEDDLEALEPDYICWASYALSRELLEATLAGGRPDPLQAILQRRVRLQGDYERLVRHAGRHQGAGLEALRSIPTGFAEE